MTTETLTPIGQRTVIFYDDELTAVLVDLDDRQVVYVPVRPICEFLGVSWNGQRERINRDPVLVDEMRFVRVTRANSLGGNPNVLALPLTFLNGWLFGINANRVKLEIRERLIRYQRECYDVLANAFLTRSSETAVTPTSTLLQVREMGLAIARMAEEQIEFDRRLTTTESRIDKAGRVVGDLTKRLTNIEKQLATGDTITDEQASQISQAVKSIALATPEKNFARIYGELYRRFGITSYKLLPIKRFAEAMQFLTDWFVRLAGDEEVPF